MTLENVTQTELVYSMTSHLCIWDTVGVPKLQDLQAAVAEFWRHSDKYLHVQLIIVLFYPFMQVSDSHIKVYKDWW